MRASQHFLTLCLLLVSPLIAADELRIYTWEEYLSQELVDMFERETGHTIKQIYYENELLRDEVINTGRGNVYDLIIVDSINLQSMAKRGLFRRIDNKGIDNTQHINAQSQEACGTSGVPYMWGTMGIAYRTSLTDHPITSWMDIFEPANEHLGKMTIPLDDVDTTAMALLALNINPFTSDRDQLMQAFELLKKLKGNVLEFRNTVAYMLENQENSQITMGVAYSGESYLLDSENKVDDWAYVVPKEGTLIWYECFASPAGQPLKQAAIDFLSFLNRPDVAAINAEAVWYATANDSAVLQASEEYRADTELFPAKEILERSFYYHPVDVDGMKLRNRMISVLNR